MYVGSLPTKFQVVGTLCYASETKNWVLDVVTLHGRLKILLLTTHVDMYLELLKQNRSHPFVPFCRCAFS
jgi:hypothetical protein